MLAQTASKTHLPWTSLTLQKEEKTLFNQTFQTFIEFKWTQVRTQELFYTHSQEKIYFLSSQHDLWVIESYGLWCGMYHQLQSNYDRLLIGETKQITEKKFG